MRAIGNAKQPPEAPHNVMRGELPPPKLSGSHAPANALTITTPHLPPAETLKNELYRIGYIDSEGNATDLVKRLPIPPINLSGKLWSFLTETHRINVPNATTFNLSQLLCYLQQFIPPTRVELIGGALLHLLGRDFFQKILYYLSLGERHRQLDPRFLYKIGKKPADQDLRYILPAGSSCQELEIIAAAYARFLAHTLCHSNQPSAIDAAVDIVESRCFKKKNHIDPEACGSHCSVRTINDEQSTEILFIERLQNSHLLTCQALYLSLANGDITTDLPNPWTPLLHQMMMLIDMEVEGNYKSSFIYTSHIIRGYVCLKNVVEKAIFSTLPRCDIAYMVKESVADHHGDDPNSMAIYIYQLLFHYEKHLEEKDFAILRKKTAPLIETRNRSSLYAALCELLRDSEIPFPLISSLFTLYAKLAAPYRGEKLRVDKREHCNRELLQLSTPSLSNRHLVATDSALMPALQRLCSQLPTLAEGQQQKVELFVEKLCELIQQSEEAIDALMPKPASAEEQLLFSALVTLYCSTIPPLSATIKSLLKNLIGDEKRTHLHFSLHASMPELLESVQGAENRRQLFSLLAGRWLSKKELEILSECIESDALFKEAWALQLTSSSKRPIANEGLQQLSGLLERNPQTASRAIDNLVSSHFDLAIKILAEKYQKRRLPLDLALPLLLKCIVPHLHKRSLEIHYRDITRLALVMAKELLLYPTFPKKLSLTLVEKMHLLIEQNRQNIEMDRAKELLEAALELYISAAGEEGATSPKSRASLWLTLYLEIELLTETPAIILKEPWMEFEKVRPEQGIHGISTPWEIAGIVGHLEKGCAITTSDAILLKRRLWDHFPKEVRLDDDEKTSLSRIILRTLSDPHLAAGRDWEIDKFIVREKLSSEEKKLFEKLKIAKFNELKKRGESGQLQSFLTREKALPKELESDPLIQLLRLEQEIVHARPLSKKQIDSFKRLSTKCAPSEAKELRRVFDLLFATLTERCDKGEEGALEMALQLIDCKGVRRIYTDKELLHPLLRTTTDATLLPSSESLTSLLKSSLDCALPSKKSEEGDRQTLALALNLLTKIVVKEKLPDGFSLLPREKINKIVDDLFRGDNLDFAIETLLTLDKLSLCSSLSEAMLKKVITTLTEKKRDATNERIKEASSLIVRLVKKHPRSDAIKELLHPLFQREIEQHFSSREWCKEARRSIEHYRSLLDIPETLLISYSKKLLQIGMGDYARALFHKITRRDMEWLSLYEEMANYLMKTKKPLLAAKDLLLLPEELFSEKLHPLHRELYDAIALLAVNKETLQIRLDLLTLHCDTSYAAPCRSLAKEIASSKLPPLLQKLWEFVEKRVLEEGLFAEDPLTKGCCINNALSYILATKEKRGKDFFSDRKKYAALYDINLPEREAIEIYQTLTKALFAEIKIPLSEDDCMTIEKLLQWKEELQKKCDKEKSLLEKISPQQQLPYWHYLDITMTNKAEKTALFTFSVEKTTPLFYALIEQLPDSTYKDIEKIMELFLDTAITLAEVAPASVDIKIILDALLKKKIPSAEEKAMVLLMMLTDGMKGEYILPKEALTSFKELLLRATRGDSISNLTLLLESRNLEPALPKGVYEPFIHEFFVELFAQCSPKDKSSKDFTRRCLTLYCYVDSPFHKSPPTEKTRAQFFALIAELMKNNSIRTSTFAIVSLYHKLLIDKCYGEESLETKENGDSSPAEHLTVKREEGLNKAVSKVTGRPSSSDEKLASQLSPLFPQNLPARQEGEAGKLFDENYHKSLLLLAKSSIESEAHNEIEALLSIKFSHKVLSHAIDHYRDKCRELDTAEAFLLFFQSQKALISEETLKKQVVAIRDLMMKLVENDSDYFKIYPLHALYAYARIDPEKCASFKEEPFYRKEMISIANALLCHPSPLALTRLLDILKHDDKELFPTLTKGKMVFFSNLMKSLEKIPLLYDNSTPFVFIKKILFEKDINKQNKGNFYEKKLMLQLLTSSLNCCTTLAKEKKYPSLLKVHLEKLIPIFTKALLQELFYSEESFSRLLTVWRDVHITYLTETADSSTVQSSIKMIAILFQRDIMEGSCSYQKIVAREIRNILLVLRELEQRSKVLSLSELRTFFSQENITIDKYETIAFKKLLSLPATGKVIHFSSDQ